MKQGSQALASVIEQMPSKRISLIRRSCRVLLARSTRPLACGELAKIISMFNSLRILPNCVIWARLAWISD